MRLYLQENPSEEQSVLFIDRENNSSLLTIRGTEAPSEQFCLPETAAELVTRATVYEEILEALDEIKLSKLARTAVETMLEELPA
jgi:hypothetical protein